MISNKSILKHAGLLKAATNLILPIEHEYSTAMTTYLLTWKPTNWHWAEFEECVAESATGQLVEGRWSCGNRKSIIEGDRVFLLRQGYQQPGLIGSGWVTTRSYEDRHWDKARRLQRRPARYVDVDWDSLQPLENRLPREYLLEEELLPIKYLNAQSGGIFLEPEMAFKLEKSWALQSGHELSIAGVMTGFGGALEGEPVEHTGYRRTRDRRLRDQAMSFANGVCAVCEIDYKAVLEGNGIRVLQVHHTAQLGYRDKPRLTKSEDLVVVCANCHLLIHLNPKKALTVSKLKRLLHTN